MFSALSLSQQLRTLSAVKAPCFSSFAALRSEPPGSARRASGSSIDDLFDRYAPKLEPMTTPGTSPSQHEDEDIDKLAGLCAAIVSQDTLPSISPRSLPSAEKTRDLKPDGGLSRARKAPSTELAPSTALQVTKGHPRVTRQTAAKSVINDDDDDDDDEPVEDEEASEDGEPASPQPPQRGKVKKAPKGAKHRRDRNRVNAQNSRAKKEHYIRWLEVKAGLAVTSQGGKDRRDAVEAAWEEKEEEASGAKGVKKRGGDDAVLASPACATKRGRKK